MNTPFIRLYNLCCGNYFYDVPKNAIVSVNSDTFLKLKELCKYGYDEFEKQYYGSNDDGYINIQKLLKQGYLTNEHPKIIYHPYTEYAEEYLNNCLNNLLLQVTQMCNFKCDYCPYSGNGLFDRVHNNKSMPIETARKVIDFFVDRSKYSRELTIGFYGGEPLLQFELIKEIVEYTEKKAAGKQIVFGMTTNGFLINNKIIGFLKRHRFSLVISFDGPKYIHDKNRKLMSNGAGTYDRVYENMHLLKENGIEFGINTVWDTEEKFNEIIDYFKNDPLLCDVSVNVQQVLTGRIGTDYVSDVDSEYQEESFAVKAYLNYLGIYKHTSKEQDEYVIKPYELIAKQIVERSGMPVAYHHGGPCIPGYLRLFVDINGIFYPCEKVSGKSSIMQIGSIDSGFNISRVKTLLNVGTLTESECKSCWAMNLCGICGMWADNNGGCLCKKSKLSRCTFIKSIVNTNIENYIVLSEIKRMLKMEENND